MYIITCLGERIMESQKDYPCEFMFVVSLGVIMWWNPKLIYFSFFNCMLVFLILLLRHAGKNVSGTGCVQKCIPPVKLEAFVSLQTVACRTCTVANSCRARSAPWAAGTRSRRPSTGQARRRELTVTSYLTFPHSAYIKPSTFDIWSNHMCITSHADRAAVMWADTCPSRYYCTVSTAEV